VPITANSEQSRRVALLEKQRPHRCAPRGAVARHANVTVYRDLLGMHGQ
jgi:hypothetical protein